MGMETLRKIIESQVNLKGLNRFLHAETKVLNGQSANTYVDIGGKRYLQLTGQDYLSLTNDPRVKRMSIEAIEKYGLGALGSPMVTGTLDLHLRLQSDIAHFTKTEGALLFLNGTLANIGCIPAIINSEYRLLARGTQPKSKRVIFADERIHKSLQMACDLCAAHGVAVYKYNHNNYDHLGHLLGTLGGDNNLVITDGVFSMDGDIAPLKEIVEIAESYTEAGKRTVVYEDDSHGWCILGNEGRGTAELLGVEGKVITMGVLSKALGGALGGFICGPKWLMDYLAYCSTHVFSLSLPPGDAAASIAAIQIVQDEPHRRRVLLENVEFLRVALKEAGFKVLGDGTQIIYIVIGDEMESSRISAKLEEEGILCPEIKCPAVSVGQAGLRFTPTFNHTREDLNFLLEKLFKITGRS